MDSASNAYNTGKEHLTNTFNTGKEHLTNTYNSIYISIKNLKPHYFKKISFPLFAIQTKMKMKNIFKSTDLKTLFLDLNIPELFDMDTFVPA